MGSGLIERSALDDDDELLLELDELELVGPPCELLDEDEGIE